MFTTNKSASLESVRDRLAELDLLDRSVSFKERYRKAVSDSQIRYQMEFNTPAVHNFTDVTGVTQGKVYAVRYDLTSGVDNHKKEVVGGLILRSVLEGKLPCDGVDTLIDAGNVNSAMALKYYTKKFGMKGKYIMSRMFPQSIIDVLESDHFQVEQAPAKYETAREREFYEYMIDRMKTRDFRKNKHCLLHARYGGEVSAPFGEKIVANLEITPTHVVSCLGAGSTLQGLQLPVQDYFDADKIVVEVAEHKLSPLFARFIEVREYKLPEMNEHITTRYAKVRELPHSAIGPHYDEINQLLPKKAISRIDEVVQYNDSDWQQMQHRLRRQGINVGNTSAANLAVAASIANEGNVVLTAVFEPFRDFYERNWDLPWIMQENTLPQQVALRTAAALWLGTAITYAASATPDWPALPF